MPADNDFVFPLPDLGEGLTHGEIIEWLVKVGDQVEADQIVVVVETTKTTAELPVPYAGRVTALHGKVTDVVPVGAPLVTLEVSAGTRAHLVGRGPAVPDPGETTGLRRLPPKPPGPSKPVAARGRTAASPAVRRLARELSVELSAVNGTGAGGAITRADVQAASQRQRGTAGEDIR